MAQTTNNLLPNWLKHFDTIESTNNYATQLIEDGMAQNGMAVWAEEQTKGKGQRGNTWKDSRQNLKVSLIVSSCGKAISPFLLNILITASIARCIQSFLVPEIKVFIKWPNDIYINDKKACGILIENRLRGSTWSHAVIGIGLNVNQTEFPKELNKATSLKLVLKSKHDFDFIEIITSLRQEILNDLNEFSKDREQILLLEYNHRLFKRNSRCHFKSRINGTEFYAVVIGVEENGNIALNQNGIEKYFSFGSLEWIFD